MKNPGFLLLLSVFVLSLSCEKENAHENESTRTEAKADYFKTLIDQTNGASASPEFMSYAYADRGTLSATTREMKDDKATQYLLELSFTSNDRRDKRNKVLFTIGRDHPSDFPKTIDNASIVFLGNQLIVEDLNSDFEYNFFVPTEQKPENKTPKIVTENCISIGIGNYDEAK